jgi:hypothetical protein
MTTMIKSGKDLTTDLPEKIKKQTIPDKIKEGIVSSNWSRLISPGRR